MEPTTMIAAASLFGGLLNSRATSATNRAQIQFSREMAQNQIQYAVNDAREAGIHPLAALGSAGANVPALNAPRPGDGINDAVSSALQYQQIQNQQRIAGANAQQIENDGVLKLAQAENLRKQTEQMGKEDNMFIRAKQNNPNLPNYGKSMWILDPELSETFENTAGKASFGFGQDPADPTKRERVKDRNEEAKKKRLENERKKLNQDGGGFSPFNHWRIFK